MENKEQTNTPTQTTTETKATQEPLKYTQKDIDNIVNSVKNNITSQMVSKDEYQKVLNEYGELKINITKDKVKEMFNQSGGNPACFDAFIKVNDGLLNKPIDEINKDIRDLQGKQPYFFVGDKTIINIDSGKETKSSATDKKKPYKNNSSLFGGNLNS